MSEDTRIFGHGRVECKECGAVVVSCRCMHADESVTYIICKDCKTKAPSDRAGDPKALESIREQWEDHALPPNDTGSGK